MKKTKLLTLALTGLLLFTSCSGNGNDDYGPDEETVSLTEPENVISKYAKGNEDHLSKALTATKYVRLHYRRLDDSSNDRAVYEPWNIWAWDITNGGNGDAYDFTHYDSYGVYVDLDLNVISSGNPITELGFIVRTDNWSKDPDGDRTIEINETSNGGIQDVYVKSADSTIFDTATNALKSTIDCAVMRSFSEIDVYFKPLAKTFKAYPKRFGIKINGEDYTDFTMDEYDGTAKSAKLRLNKDLDISDEIYVTYKFDETWTNKVPLMVTSYFDSEEFMNNYSYTGSDLGATFDDVNNPTKTTFKLWAPTTKSVTLNVYNSGDYKNDLTARTFTMTKASKGVFEYTVNEDLDGKYYTYTVTNSKGTNEVVDPYAKSAGLNGRRGMVVNFNKLNKEIVGWTNDARSTKYGKNNVDGSIYEMHVRDMTINENSGVSENNRGTFLGMSETGTTYTENGVTVKTGLDHVKELGVSHVQIQPFYDYSSVDEANVFKTMSDVNYNWGYDPLNYNVLEGGYSTNPSDGYNRIKEFKQMVMAMHNNDININMDVVYNHTASTDNSNFNLIVPYYYYRTFSSGKFYNGSGCGNEMASERFMVNKFVRESCKFWIDEYHLSGFRFDLMGLLDNQTMIDVYNDCKALDPQIMIYGEPWTGGTTKLKEGNKADALKTQKTVQSSLAQSYFSGNNVLVGAFNDVIRNAIRGENSPSKGYVQGLYANAINIKAGVKGAFSTSDAVAAKINPNQVINYVSCHDNYTLYDQIVQTMKSGNLNNAYTQAESIVFLSEGVPFLQEGEEFMRSKERADGTYEGNSYNVGDSINNMDYSLKIKNASVNEKFKELIQFRKDNAQFRLATRAEIDEKLIDSTVAGVVTYKIDDLVIIHASAGGREVTLDGTYNIVYSNVKDSYDGLVANTYTTVENESIVLKKAN